MPGSKRPRYCVICYRPMPTSTYCDDCKELVGELTRVHREPTAAERAERDRRARAGKFLARGRVYLGR